MSARRLAGLCAVSLVFVTAGCAGSGPAPERSGSPAPSEQPSLPAGPSESIGAARLIVASADRAHDAKSMRMSIEMETRDGRVVVDGAFADRGSRMPNGTWRVRVMRPGASVAFETVEMRIVGDAFFVSANGFGSQMVPNLPPGTEWIAMDPEAMTEQHGGKATSGGNPFGQFSDSFTVLRGASDEVRVVGPDLVRGVETTHYRLLVNPAKALAAAPPSERRNLVESFASYRDKPFPVEVWIDSDGLPRRVRMDIDVGAIGTDLPDRGPVTVTIEMYDFGVPVEVDRPPARSTVNLFEAMGSMLAA